MPRIRKSEILLVINPNAGKRNIRLVMKTIREMGNDIQYIITHDLQAFEQEIKKEFDTHKVFVAVGGDGTVNSLIKYLIHCQDKALAILPFGSGNGFANELGFKNDLKNLINKIIAGDMLDIDVLEINGNYFLNLAGIGLDAEIAHRFQTSGERGFISYIFSTIRTYFSYKPILASISGDNIQEHGHFQMMCIANTRQFGNNAYISPKSDPMDGTFEIILLKDIPFLHAISFVIRLFKGTLKDSTYIKYLVSDGPVDIETNSNKYHIDGDPMTSDGNYHINLNPKSLKVVKMYH
ncbi:MAG: YegS/Rv2252/BmrU family lipid kinase [Bacteroidota bacterium]|nr:YegS/Rv2252/BmrU family lipid kinase [Bacteroidota bacterium]